MKNNIISGESRPSLKRKPLFLAALMTAALFCHCQHAKIKYPDRQISADLPKECKPPVKNRKNCDTALQKQSEEKTQRENALPEVHFVHQPYYLAGIFPKTASLDISDLCRNGISEIHQFTSLKDGTIELFTLGIYSPQTVKVICQK